MHHIIFKIVLNISMYINLYLECSWCFVHWNVSTYMKPPCFTHEEGVLQSPCIGRPWSNPMHRGPCKSPRGFMHTNIHTYAYFGLFSYRYWGCFAKSLYIGRFAKYLYREGFMNSLGALHVQKRICTYRGSFVKPIYRGVFAKPLEVVKIIVWK